MSRNDLGRLPFQQVTPNPLGDRRPGQRDVSIAMRPGVTRHCDVLSGQTRRGRQGGRVPAKRRPPREQLKLARHRTTIKPHMGSQRFRSVQVSASPYRRSGENTFQSSRSASTFIKCDFASACNGACSNRCELLRPAVATPPCFWSASSRKVCSVISARCAGGA
jgi:hypothetical protein